MNKKRILPSRQIDSNESEPKSPPSKRRRLTYEEKRDFLMSNKRVTIIECVVVDILENNLRCLVNYKCIHERTLNNLRTIFKNIYLFMLILVSLNPVSIFIEVLTKSNLFSDEQYIFANLSSEQS